MNQGRIWCVVHPTVGLPLLLGSVTLIALGVHTAVLTNTTWFSGYWQGAAKVHTSATDVATPKVASATPGYAITVAPAAATQGGATSFVVTVAPAAATPSVTTLAEATTPSGPPPDGSHAGPLTVARQ